MPDNLGGFQIISEARFGTCWVELTFYSFFRFFC